MSLVYTNYILTLICLAAIIFIFRIKFRSFVQIVYTLILFISLFAAFSTQGRTIMLPCILISILLLKKSCEQIHSVFRISSIVKDLVVLFMLNLILNVLFIYVIYHIRGLSDKGYQLGLVDDNMFYINQGAIMLFDGVESISPTNSPTIYHYIDLWFYSIFTPFVKAPIINYFIYIPFISSFNQMLVYEVVHKYSNFSVSKNLLYFLIIVLSLAVPLCFFFKIFDSIPGITLSIFSYYKYHIIVLLIAIFIYNLDNYERLYYSGILISLCFPTLAPSVIFYLFFEGISYLFNSLKSNNFKGVLMISLITILTITSLFIFTNYVDLLKNPESKINNFDFSLNINVENFVLLPLHLYAYFSLLFYTLPFFLFKVKLYFKLLKNPLYFKSLKAVLGGSLFTILLYDNHVDVSQFFILPCIAFGIINLVFLYNACFVKFQKALNNVFNKLIFYSFIIASIAILIYINLTKYKVAFHNTQIASELLNNLSKVKGAYFIESNTFFHNRIYNISPQMFVQDEIFEWNNLPVRVEWIGFVDDYFKENEKIPFKEFVNKSISDTKFNNYVINQKNFNNKEKLILNYLKQKKFNVIIYYGKNVPDYLKKLAKSDMIYLDEFTCTIFKV